MTLRILATSDLHLGLKFTGYPDAVREKLIEARFKTLDRLVDTANRERCDLLVVAGDLFDRDRPAARAVSRAARALSEFGGKLAAVLPGNHDFMQEAGQDLWGAFREAAAGRVLVLRDKAPVALASYDVDACLYPCPCDAKHSDMNRVGWVAAAAKDPGIRHHIGIAHGSLEGVSPDMKDGRRYFPMTREELAACGVHLWLLGHTHIQYPPQPSAGDRIFLPSTPEPDGFDCGHEGRAWVLDLGDDGALTARSLSTGTYRFAREQARVADAAAVERLAASYDAGSGNVLLRLRLEGRLSEDGLRALGVLREDLARRVFHLEWDDEAVAREITAADIDREFAQGSFPHRLLTELAKRSEDFGALQEAFRIIQEVRS